MYRSVLFRILYLLCITYGLGQTGKCASGAQLLFREGIGGTIGSHSVKPDESLVELARQYGLGYNAIAAANPGVDPFVPDAGTSVTIPGRLILPDVPRKKGIVINVAEMRLYYFTRQNGNLIDTFPVGIGDEGWETPLGSYRIIEKTVNPAWHVPASIRRQKPHLPAIVPPGPDNPLGNRALRLSRGAVLIHGTDRPFGIGRRVSHGCIHLYPEDIVKLFRKVKTGTRVSIVSQPVKAAVVDGRVMVEVHGSPDEELFEAACRLLAGKGLIDRVHPGKLLVAASEKRGMPVDVSW